MSLSFFPRVQPIFQGAFAQDLEAFLIDRRARGLAPRTVEWYAEQLKPFLLWLEEQGITEVLAITPEHLRRYLIALGDEHNPGGVAGRFRAIRAFLNWWGMEYAPDDWHNPIRRVRPPRVPVEPLDPVDLEDLCAMLATCEPKTFHGDRDRAILMFLLDSGVRRAEFLALNVGDVNLKTGAVVIRHAKNNKTRVTFIGAKTRKAVHRYLQHRGPLRDSAPLWVTQEGERLTPWGLRGLIRRRALLANVPEPSIHSFRRGFALAALRSGIDLLTVARLLGHSSLAVVSRYIKQIEADLAEAHARAGIVDGLLDARR